MRSYFVKEVGATMRYQEFEGHKTPIIMIHGLGCAGSFDYPEVATCGPLNEHRRILVDLLGAGFSDKPNQVNYEVSFHAGYLEKFIEDLGVKSVIIFGHSLGGAVAIELAKRCEEKLEALILSESNLDPSGTKATSYFIAKQKREDFLKIGFQKLIESSQIHGNEMWAAVLSTWLPQAVYELSQSGVQGGTPSFRQTLYDIKKPRGFIFGEQSLPDDDEVILAKENIKIELVKNAGHSMAWENPKGLAEAIERLICRE